MNRHWPILESERPLYLFGLFCAFECFSSWSPSELKAFSDFLIKLKSAKWKDIYATGGKKGTKSGLGYTPHKNRSMLPNNPELKDISPDITFFELRVTQKARVHGFRVKSAFFLVWLDKNHRIYPVWNSESFLSKLWTPIYFVIVPIRRLKTAF